MSAFLVSGGGNKYFSNLLLNPVPPILISFFSFMLGAYSGIKILKEREINFWQILLAGLAGSVEIFLWYCCSLLYASGVFNRFIILFYLVIYLVVNYFSIRRILKLRGEKAVLPWLLGNIYVGLFVIIWLLSAFLLELAPPILIYLGCFMFGTYLGIKIIKEQGIGFLQIFMAALAGLAELAVCFIVLCEKQGLYKMIIPFLSLYLALNYCSTKLILKFRGGKTFFPWMLANSCVALAVIIPSILNPKPEIHCNC